jgi:gamma-tubulin complex component 5
MRQNKRWSDFQLLTSTLRDAVTSSSDVWINPILVRASASRRASENISQTVSAIKVDYQVCSNFRITAESSQVPFPLSQLFTTTSMELRSDIFTFLLQLLHARRSLIDLASFMSDVSDRPAGELRRLWRLRHKLAWVFE